MKIEVCDKEIAVSKAQWPDLIEALEEIVANNLTPFLGHEDEQDRAKSIIDELNKRLCEKDKTISRLRLKKQIRS